MITVKVKRVNKDVPLPEYSSEGDGCMDLRVALGKETYQGRSIQVAAESIRPDEIRVFDTGLIFEIPDNHVMKIYPRSSTGIKLNLRLANSTGILDSQFRQTCKIALHNFGDEPVLIEHLQRVAQFEVVPSPRMQMIEVEEVSETSRGEGIGSSGVI